MHALIVGERGVGKSSLIHRVLNELKLPVHGFETKKEGALADEYGCPVYIYEIGKTRERSSENLVGWASLERPEFYIEAFDRFAPKLSDCKMKSGVIMMDEIGFMESAAKEFCGSVLSVLDDGTPVIAAVKDRCTPFLEEVRRHPNCRCFYITEENRNKLFPQVLKFMREQITGGKSEYGTEK